MSEVVIPYQNEKIIQDSYKTVRQNYKDHDADYFESANESNERIFFKLVKQSGKPVTRKITQVVRLKSAGKDYVYYHETLESQNNIGKKITHSRVIGFHKKPEFEPVISDGGDVISASTSDFETIYEIPFSAPLLEQEIEPYMIDNVSLVIKALGRNYSGFSYDQFKTLSFDELITYGKYGTLTPKIELKK